MYRSFSQVLKTDVRMLLTGANGQIGKQLVPYIQSLYGRESVVVTDLKPVQYATDHQPPFLTLDITVSSIQDPQRFLAVAKQVQPTHTIHLAAFLSAKAELNLANSLQVNIGGVNHALEVAKELGCSIYIPSSIAAFGPSSPRVATPNECVLEPHTVYGISKVYVESMGSYYFRKFGVDFRSIRYPGAISSDPPGGGTTDYAVEIFFEAVRKGAYECFLQADTRLPMIHMNDLIRGTLELVMAPADCLTRRVYNMAAISFTPAELAQALARLVPHLQVSYKPDRRQAYADSWPQSIDDSQARRDWGWQHVYDLDRMTEDIYKQVKARISSA